MALALAGTIAWECLGARTDDAAPPLPAETPDRPRGGPAEARQDHTEAQVAVTLARPLFSSTRRPPREVNAEVAPGEPTPPPRLAGVLVSRAGRRAIFAPAEASGKAMTAGEGDHVGAFVVGAITVGAVTMLVPDGGTRVVHPAPDPAARAAFASAAPAGAAPLARPPILDLVHSIPGEGGTKSSPPGPARPGPVPPGAAR